MNCTVLTWIYCTIHADLQQSTMIRKPNARGAWLYLESEFLGQRESRALLLSAEFRTAKQGSSSITDFCRRLETMSATLTDYGDPIGDRTLVLTLLCGLSEKFGHVRTNIKLRQPFPTFEEARTILLLEEIEINDSAVGEAAGASDSPPASSTTSALVAGTRTNSGRGGQGGQGHAGYQQGHRGGTSYHQGQPSHYGKPSQAGGQGNDRSDRRRGGHGRQQQQPQQSGGAAGGHQRPPMHIFNPWTGTVQLWPPQPAAGGSGAPLRPPPTAPAFAAVQQPYGQPQYTYAPPGFGYGGQPAPPPPQQPWTPIQGMSWDPSVQGLVSNFNTMTLTPPSSSDW
jgi:hypothetical protein